MNEPAAMRIWMRGSIPDRFQGLIPSEIETGMITLFLAHVPASVLTDPIYRECNGEEGIDGWMREGELGLFGANGLDVHDHPDGDGLLILGVCV
ncbi:MAG: hypothetical protein U0800_10325 [Isosphaeraceae bacterium]